MKQIIEVPEGHTVTITQKGNQLTVEMVPAKKQDEQLTVEMVPAKKQDEQAFISLKDGEKLRTVTSNIFDSWRR